MRKLLSVDPAKIGRPPGQTSPDAIPEELLDGTPSPLRLALEQLLGPERVLHRLVDLVRYASDASPYRLVPQAVVVAHDANDVAKVLDFCAKTDRHATFSRCWNESERASPVRRNSHRRAQVFQRHQAHRSGRAHDHGRCRNYPLSRKCPSGTARTQDWPGPGQLRGVHARWRSCKQCRRHAVHRLSGCLPYR